MIMLSPNNNNWWESNFTTSVNNSTPATKRVTKSKEEEISVDDLPF
jgi:hypothetical protein